MSEQMRKNKYIDWYHWKTRRFARTSFVLLFCPPQWPIWYIYEWKYYVNICIHCWNPQQGTSAMLFVRQELKYIHLLPISNACVHYTLLFAERINQATMACQSHLFASHNVIFDLKYSETLGKPFLWQMKMQKNNVSGNCLKKKRETEYAFNCRLRFHCVSQN